MKTEEEKFSEASENFCQITRHLIQENGTILYVIIIIIIIVIFFFFFFFFFFLSKVRSLVCSNFTMSVSVLDAPHLFRYFYVFKH